MALGWFPRALKRRRPSELIRDHLNDAGNGFELDDLVSSGRAGWEDVAEKVLEINLRHGWPLGVYTEEAREDLSRLAAELEAQGR